MSFVFFSFFPSPNLSRRRLDVCHTSTHGVALCEFKMQVWNLLHAARWKHGTQKINIWASSQLCRAISSQQRHVSTIGKKLLSSSMSSTCHHNMVNFGPLAAEINPVVWGTPCKLQRLSRLGSITARHLVVGVSQTLRRWTEGATYVRQGDHQVGPTF